MRTPILQVEMTTEATCLQQINEVLWRTTKVVPAGSQIIVSSPMQRNLEGEWVIVVEVMSGENSGLYLLAKDFEAELPLETIEIEAFFGPPN